MEENAFYVALSLLVNLDASLYQIVVLSLQVSLLAVLIAAFLGFPLGAAVALWQFPGRNTCDMWLKYLARYLERIWKDH